MASKADMEKRLREVRQKLAEIDALKQQEPALRREESVLATQLRADNGDADPAEIGQALAAAEPKAQEAPLSVEDAEETKKKRMKALNKKLQQIEALRTKDGPLDAEAKAKIDSEAKIRYELECVRDNKPVDPYWEPPVRTEQLPRDAGEREKRVKVLRKKAQQIEALKERTDELDAEARNKVESERAVNQEIAALESGASEVKFAPPSEDEKMASAQQEKTEVEKKIKAVKKKLDQIEALKAKGGDLDADKQAKLDSEAQVKKELGAQERRLGELNKAERDRVANKLGFADEAKANMDSGKKKKSGKK